MHACLNGFTPLSRGIDPVREWELHGIVVTVLAIVIIVLSPSLRRSLGDRAATANQPLLLESPP